MADIMTQLGYHLKTVFLFTKSDYKTIFFPVTMFASAVAPPKSFGQWVTMLIWIWFHLLQANVSNQNFSAEEDSLNKPWRPLPSGRITEKQTRYFRWCLLAFDLALSCAYGPGVLGASAALTVTEIVHDDLGWSQHQLSKNFCNIFGYITFETGATLILSGDAWLDRTALRALLLSGCVIFTTIHAQDFADREGDEKTGRKTLPVIAPEASRISILCMLIAWSHVLVVVWGLGPASSIVFIALGMFVGGRYYMRREVKEDETSYVLYNIWLLSAHILPANARLSWLAW